MLCKNIITSLNRCGIIETEIIPDCGHGLAIEQTEMVDKRILEFLRRS